MLAIAALLLPPRLTFPDPDAILSRPYTAEVPFGSSGDRMWATSPQGWAFTEGVNFLEATNRGVFAVRVRSGDASYQVGSAQYFPSHIHMTGRVGVGDAAAKASYSSSGDSPSNPLTEPFRPDKRWTSWNSGRRSDWYALDFGDERRVEGIALWFFDDRPKGECAPPESVLIERRLGGSWTAVETEPFAPQQGKTLIRFAGSPVRADALRLTFRHRAEKLYTGLYGVRLLTPVQASPKGRLAVEGDKWISRDDVLVSRISVANPTRAPQPFEVEMRQDPGTSKPISVQGFPLVMSLGGSDGTTRALRFKGQLKPGERRRFTFAAGVGASRSEADAGLSRWVSAKNPAQVQTDEYRRWFSEQAPRFVCSDPLVTKMFYHRLYNLKKNSMNPRLGRLSHRAFSEGRWRSGWYANVISYGAGHQIRESRWLKDESYAWGHLLTFTENPRPDGIFPSHVTAKGQQGGRYTDWITSSAWDAFLVHPDKAALRLALPALAANARGWRKVYGWGDSPLLVVDDHWWTGMEWQPSFFSFNGYRTDRETPLRRVDLTSYNYGNERAVANACRALGDVASAAEFDRRAEETRTDVLKQMWDPETHWFHSLRASDGAMSPAKEIIGIYPFAFDLPPRDYASAWKTLLDPNLFWTTWPLASAAKDCPAFSQDGWPVGPGGSNCMWNGPSWPHANGLVMTAMENTLRHLPGSPLKKEDFYRLFISFTKVQFVNGQPWTGEFYDGDTGAWKTRERDYNHSIWLDPLIGGLIGIVPRADDVLEIDPLLPDGKWAAWKLDNQWYHGRRLMIAFENGRFTVDIDGRRSFAAAKPMHVRLALRPRTKV